MLAHARLKLKNAESSIAFIQEQHTRTLEGLHQEIQKLQQKNARLTFELAVKGSTSSATGLRLLKHHKRWSHSIHWCILSAGSSECCKHARKELQSYKSQVNSLQAALTVCKEEIKMLRHRLFNSESIFSVEVCEREAQISQLGAKLNHKARMIAHLTKQLHQMKNELTQASTSLMQTVAATTLADYSISQHRTTTADHSPTGQIRRRVRRVTASDLLQNAEQRESHDKRRSLPTPTMHTRPHPPTISPQPPPTSQIHQRILNRASRVAHRGTQSVTSLHDEASSTTDLDAVQLKKKQRPDISDLLEKVKSDFHITTKSSTPILPPIPTNPDLTAPQTSGSSSRIPDCPIHQSPRHAILSRLQGQDSAPTSVRLRRRPVVNVEAKDDQKCPHSRERGRDGEGMLLVKEDVHKHGKSQAWQELHQSGSD